MQKWLWTVNTNSSTITAWRTSGPLERAHPGGRAGGSHMALLGTVRTAPGGTGAVRWERVAACVSATGSKACRLTRAPPRQPGDQGPQHEPASFNEAVTNAIPV